MHHVLDLAPFFASFTTIGCRLVVHRYRVEYREYGVVPQIPDAETGVCYERLHWRSDIESLRVTFSYLRHASFVPSTSPVSS